MTTDLEMDALDLIYIYGLRFKIEVSFKAAVTQRVLSLITSGRGP